MVVCCVRLWRAVLGCDVGWDDVSLYGVLCRCDVMYGVGSCRFTLH